MRLVEQPMPQSYHLQDNGWTPLSQNPCWHRWYSPWPMFVYSNNLRVNIICQNNVHVGQVKSFVDDLKGTGYCKHESSLCATICWGSALVPAICARLVQFHNCELYEFCHFSSPQYTTHTIHGITSHTHIHTTHNIHVHKHRHTHVSESACVKPKPCQGV